MADTLTLLGSLAPPDAGRDAIHIAVFPAVAGHILTPAEHVGWMDASKQRVGRAPTPAERVGVVDPFLTTRVMPGERCFVFLYPATISGLRHVWSHPAFPEEGQEEDKVQMLIMPVNKTMSEQWIRDFLNSVDSPGYRNFMAVIEDFVDSGWQGDAPCFGEDAGGDLPPEFWNHAEVVLGKKIPAAKRADHFRCAC